MVVCVNKMDTVKWKEARYEEIKLEVSDYLKKCGFSPKKVLFVPVSGWCGDNLIEKSTNMPWYKGPTFLQTLDLFEIPARSLDKPLRMPIRDVYRIGGIGLVSVGVVETGTVQPGMALSFAPGNHKAECKSIEMHFEPLKEAKSGNFIGINLKNTYLT